MPRASTPAADPARVGARLRAIRESRSLTLGALSSATGISISTLSRLESGLRRVQLDHLLPLAQVYRLPLDDLVGAVPSGDPRLHPRTRFREGVVTVPLSVSAGPWEAFKQVLPPAPDKPLPQWVHAGWDWIYVISGRMTLMLDGEVTVVDEGGAVEFDTRIPHGFGNAGPGVLEVLCLFNADGRGLVTRSRRPETAEVSSTPGPASSNARRKPRPPASDR